MRVLRWPAATSSALPLERRHRAGGHPCRGSTSPGAARNRANRFGTDEFLAYRAELGTQPYICLNMGTGTLEEARAWVEYCNRRGDTHWAELRAASTAVTTVPGQVWPRQRMYGEWQVGGMAADEYVREATRRSWVQTFRTGIELVSCGKTGWNDWDRAVSRAWPSWSTTTRSHLHRLSEDYWTNVLEPHQAERAMSASALIRHTAYRREIEDPSRIAYDEWNVWYRRRRGPGGAVHVRGRPRGGTYLNIFVRNGGGVKMANLAQMVNVIAPGVTAPERPAPAHSIRCGCTRRRGGQRAGRVRRPPPPSTRRRLRPPRPHQVADIGPFTALDVAATVSANTDRVALTIVNRDPVHPGTAEIILRDFAFAGPAENQDHHRAGGPGEPRVLPDVPRPCSTWTRNRAPQGRRRRPDPATPVLHPHRGGDQPLQPLAAPAPSGAWWMAIPQNGFTRSLQQASERGFSPICCRKGSSRRRTTGSPPPPGLPRRGRSLGCSPRAAAAVFQFRAIRRQRQFAERRRDLVGFPSASAPARAGPRPPGRQLLTSSATHLTFWAWCPA